MVNDKLNLCSPTLVLIIYHPAVFSVLPAVLFGPGVFAFWFTEHTRSRNELQEVQLQLENRQAASTRIQVAAFKEKSM